MEVFKAVVIGMVGMGFTGVVFAALVNSWEARTYTAPPDWIGIPIGIMLLVGMASVPVGTVYLVVRALN